MKDEATPEQMAMARRIARETFPPPDEAIRRDGAYRGALAAIIETQRLDAELAETFATFGNRVPERVAAAIRSGAQLKGQDHG